jgi:plasmid stability protein
MDNSILIEMEREDTRKNLKISYELWKELKILAAQEDKQLKDLVEEILKQALQSKEEVKE